VPQSSKTSVREVWLVLLGRLADQAMLPAAGICRCRFNTRPLPSSWPWSAACPTKNQPSKKPSLLTILGPSSIRWRRRRQAKPVDHRRNIKSKALLGPQNRAVLVPRPSLRRCCAVKRAVACRYVSTSMRRRRVAFEPAVAMFEQAEECAGAQGIMHHAQPDQQSNSSLRMMQGTQAACFSVTPSFKPTVAMSRAVMSLI
jgi:hypothetical protein